MKAKKRCHTGVEAEPEPHSTALSSSWPIFFDVPVYRLTKGEYEATQDAFVRQELAYGGYYVEEMYRQDPKRKEQRESYQQQAYGGHWLFNEIIGWIRLYFCSTQIRGEYWCVAARRIVRTRKKCFTYSTWKVTCEENIPAGSSNQEIFKLIQKYLARARREEQLKGRYVHAAVLENIGPHVDWNGLLKCNLRKPSAVETPPAFACRLNR